MASQGFAQTPEQMFNYNRALARQQGPARRQTTPPVRQPLPPTIGGEVGDPNRQPLPPTIAPPVKQPPPTIRPAVRPPQPLPPVFGDQSVNVDPSMRLQQVMGRRKLQRNSVPLPSPQTAAPPPGASWNFGGQNFDWNMPSGSVTRASGIDPMAGWEWQNNPGDYNFMSNNEETMAFMNEEARRRAKEGRPVSGLPGV